MPRSTEKGKTAILGLGENSLHGKAAGYDNLVDIPQLF